MARTGGGFGGSFLVMCNYWDMDHYHRVEAAIKRKNARDKANGTMRGPRGDPPPPPPMVWDCLG